MLIGRKEDGLVRVDLLDVIEAVQHPSRVVTERPYKLACFLRITAAYRPYPILLHDDLIQFLADFIAIGVNHFTPCHIFFSLCLRRIAPLDLTARHSAIYRRGVNLEVTNVKLEVTMRSEVPFHAGI